MPSRRWRALAAPSSGPRGVQVDVRLDEVVLRALERKPELRYQHASQVKTAVENIASTQFGGSPGTPPHVQVPDALLQRDYRLQIRFCLRRGNSFETRRNFRVASACAGATVLRPVEISGSLRPSPGRQF